MFTFHNFTNKALQTDLRVTISKERVLCKLKALTVDKSAGPDQMHPRVLQEMSDCLATLLSILFKASLDHGEVPEQWKLATMTPIYKKGDKTNPANYRPVSLTSVVCKIFERMLSEDITNHLKTNSLHPAQQHGFTTGKSTVTNLLEAMDIWTEALNYNLPVEVIFLD